MSRFYLLFTLLITLVSCQNQQVQETVTVQSPSGEIAIKFQILEGGLAAYDVKFQGNKIIDTSFLAFDLRNTPSIDSNLTIVMSVDSSFSEKYELPWGEQREVENKFNEMFIQLKETGEPGRLINIRFRAYDDGIGFRYEFPEQENWSEAIIMDELTEFNLTDDHMCWWTPGDWDIYEHKYVTSKISEIDAISKRNHPNLAQTYIPYNAVNTPVTLRTEQGVHLSFHEADLTDYSGMTLMVDPNNLKFISELVGSETMDYKVKRTLPFHTPWRLIQICDKATELIDSKLVLNLNEPNILGDVSWFKPTKYMGIWWEMHLGKSSWDKKSGKHGATTENAKAFIDFASENEIGAILVEGWNTGWERWIGFPDREGVFDFVTPYDDYDLEEVVAYGNAKGVDLIMHHETSAAVRTYDQQLDTAYTLMNRLGIHAVKTGYVGPIIPTGEYHHGQYMVNHYRKVIETAANYQIAINAHEPIKPTGIRRTYPNTISREGLRGQEFNAWATDGGNPPEHLSIVAFTRMLAGPVDFTPGIFKIKLDPYKKDNQVNTTLAHQLALYVVIYSPIQMAADLLEHYEAQPAFQFIRDVGVDWDETVVINGEVGDFVTIARKERDSENWYLGAITDENERTMSIDFDFLDIAKKYNAIVYKDGPTAHWDENPTDINIDTIVIRKNDKIDFKLSPGGGLAISLELE